MGQEVMQDVPPQREHGPMLTACSAPGCSTLTMGGTCVEHDPPVSATYPRGRPYVARLTSPPELSLVGGGRLESPA
jgi:hypothetical protein